LEVSYGKPKGNSVWENNKLFKLPFLPTQAPKLLFHRIEQCQKIALIMHNPYIQEKLIANAIHLLFQSGIFPMNEFEDWEATMIKTWPELKKFIRGAYRQRLIAVQLCNTSGQQGYAPSHNMYNVLSTWDSNTDTNNDAAAMTITQSAVAATMGSMLGNTYMHTNVPVHSKVSTAINQLSANQAALYQQMVALSFHAPAQRSNMFQVPPIQTLTIPGIPPPFAIDGATAGRSARSGRHRERGCGHSGWMQTPFADHMAGGGGGGFLTSAGDGIPPFQQGGAFPQMG
jgi:hypothetical protein